jgi:hypothetical protein
MIRNPVDAIYSLFRFRLYVGTEHAASLAEALAKERVHMGRQVGASIEPLNLYQEVYMYYAQIYRYFDVFTPARVHVVVYDDMQRDMANTFCGILEFLEVDSSFRPRFVNVNKTGKLRSRSLQHIISCGPTPLKRLAYMLPRAIRRPAYKALHRLNTSYAPPPSLDPDLRARLKSVERLSALIGRDLTHWTAN